MAKGTARVSVTLQSIGNGMLQNPMTNKTLEELRTGVRGAIDKTLEPKVMAEAKVMMDIDGKIGVKLEYLVSCLGEAGRLVKNGKKQISTAKSTTLFSFLNFGEISFLPFSSHSDMEVDMRKGNLENAGKSTAVCIVRPLFKQWTIDLDIIVTTEGDFACAVDTVKQLFDAAGSQVGLGDFRPAKKGPFGRFKVSKWEILK